MHIADVKEGYWTALYAGDTTLVIEFDNIIKRSVVEKVNALNERILAAITAGNLRGVLETVPTFRSLALVYDPLTITPSALLDAIRTLDTDTSDTNQTSASRRRHWQLPVLYGGEQGPDLADVAQRTGLSTDEVIQLHSQDEVTAYMLGFLPGYAFLGDTPKTLHLPRRTEPRLRVPAGSVAIAMQLTGVYPWESPGGWHIIGNCPIPMFDASVSPPALLRAGDKVSFNQIDRVEFDTLLQASSDGNIERSRWMTSRL